jgi:hypothetical protein
MSLSLDESLRHLNDCECCEGISAETPARVENRPGLSAIGYRVGTHAQFKETMLARLSGSRQGALRGLTTRADEDFTIALLDAWAVVADVLTFYQERIANESYLRTATERLSVSELARLIGYQLQPGVSASVYLAFTIEDAPGALGPAINLGSSAGVVLEPPPPVLVDAGVKVQSIPGPGEKAQTYETVEKMEARPEWNAIKPRLTQPQPLSANTGSLILQGAVRDLKKGDVLLVVDSADNRTLKTILMVTVDDRPVDESAKSTRVDFVSPPSALPGLARPSGLPNGSVNDFPTKVEVDESVVGQIISKIWSEENLSALAKVQDWPLNALIANINKQTARRSLPANTGVFVFRQHAAIFGYNAPKWDSLPASLRFDQRIAKYKLVDNNPQFEKFEFVPAAFPVSWEDLTLAAVSGADGTQLSVSLDSTYPAVIKESWIALVSPGKQSAVVKVLDNIETTKSAFAISGKVSRLLVETNAPLANFLMRKTVALVQSELLALADLPIEESVPAQDGSVTLDRAYLGLKVGQTVVLTGERDDLKGSVASEVRRLKDVTIEGGFTAVTFDRALTYRYLRNTITINANVALATHGESVEEVLGGGDATKLFQSFTLRQPPLTYTSAETATGSETSLEVRINDLLWKEVPSFFGHRPEERIYVTRTDTEGKTTVTFGDGRTGARLPSGQENVKAKYRKGTGLGGLVKAGQLSQLMTRPLGVKGVVNPEKTTGGEDPEQLEDARANAPLTVLTLGRVVSLQDYEDFSRSFAGIAKALATWVWTGQQRAVHLTVAGAQGAEVDANGDVGTKLFSALRLHGDSRVPIILESYQPRFFILSAAIKIGPDHLRENVFAAVEAKLRESFSFEQRSFGQSANLSEIFALIMKVAGVLAVDVNDFYGTDAPPAIGEPRVKPRLEARRPRPGDEAIFPAQILMIDPRPLVLEVMP